MLTHLNKSLLPLLEEDTNFEDVAPSLFRPEFARKSKDLVDQVRAIRSTTQKDPRPFFDRSPQEGVTVNAPGEAEAKALGRGIGSSNRAGEPMDQTAINCHMYVNHLLINYKSALTHQISCMG